MVYRQILTPDEKNHSIEMPEHFFGRRVEVIVMEITDSVKNPTPPTGKKSTVSELLEDFGTAPDFPSVEEIRSKAWPSKW